MHDHAAHVTAGARHRGRLALVLAMAATLLVVELVVARATGSLALLSDAGHLATDLVGLSIALAAVTAASRPSSSRTSFGWYRLEVLAALLNGALLLALAAYVAFEALRRFDAGGHLDTVPLMATAAVALSVNLVSARLLRAGAEENLNLEGARLEVLADAVGSVGVLAGAALIHVTGWTFVDRLVGLAIAAWIVPRALRLAWRAVRVLLQASPDHLDTEAATEQLQQLPGVTGVHDLHVWTLTSGMDVASVHVRVGSSDLHHETLHRARELLRSSTGTDHVTVQVELDDDACCEGHPAW